VSGRALTILRCWLLAGCAAGLLAGCLAERWSYTKPGLTPARLDLDLESCRREAHRPHWFALTRSARLDQDVLNQCMERKGYNAQRDE
jgi:hypothetical protein